MKRLLIASFLLSSACANPVWRLEPIDESVRWDQGNALITQSQDGISATLHYVRHSGNAIVLDLEVINETDDALHIDPKAIHAYTYAKKPSSKSARIVKTFFAFDPEERLISLEKTMSRETNSYVTGQFLNLASDLVSNDQDRVGNAIDRQTQSASFDHRIASLRSQHQAWTTMALRKTDLGPNQVVNGFIQFSFDPEAEYYRVIIPYGERPFEFIFRQNRH